ncbi:hypothetical protein GCM10009759_72590 [Kitasatospora saccharophila]|uniref:Uncharacterized protein n=1 Tax=Kitasatospora saccharophila TaxID=407973 RepID=A0ABP5JZB6_9ACTN
MSSADRSNGTDRHPTPEYRWYSTPWHTHAVARIDYLQSQFDEERTLANGDHDTRDLIDSASEILAKARASAAKHSPLGASKEHTWTSIHAAEILLFQISIDGNGFHRRAATIPNLLRYLGPSFQHREKIEEICARSMDAEAPPSPQEREALLGALIEAYRNRDREFVRIRNITITLFVSTFLTFVLAAALPLLLWSGLLAPLDLCFAPTGGPVCASGVHGLTQVGSIKDVVLIEACGILGATLTALLSLHEWRGTVTPYKIQLASASLKIPSGALSAVIGITMIRAGFIPGLTDLDSSTQILAWAIVFGASQHLITRLVDNRIRDVLPDENGSSAKP